MPTPLLTLPLAVLLAAMAPPPAAVERVTTAFGTVEVWIERPADGGLATAVGSGIIAAPPERVFAVLLDHATYPEWVPFLVACEATTLADGSVLHRQHLDLPFPLSGRHYAIIARQGHDAATAGEPERWWTAWSLAPGDRGMAAQSGSWTLIAGPPDRGGSTTLARLELRVDPGGLVPRFAVERGTRRALPWTFDGLRQQVRRWRYVTAVP